MPHPESIFQLAAMADAAMAEKEEPESQEHLGVELPAAPEVPHASVRASPGMVSAELSQQELEVKLFASGRRSKQKPRTRPHRRRHPRRSKKQKTEDEEDLANLRSSSLTCISTLQIWMRSCKTNCAAARARGSIWWLFIAQTVYNPEDGTWMPQATTKKREFGAITGREVPDITAETNVQEAVMKYHEKSILPSLAQLQ